MGGTRPNNAISKAFQMFYTISRSGGGLLMLGTILSLLLANSSFSESWTGVWKYSLGPQINGLHLHHSVVGWINDGLMTLFFLMVGLEIEREWLVGELRSRKSALLPIVAAIGGMLFPAMIYFLLNLNHPEYWSCAGVPTATDIAFALAVIGLLGKRVPNSLKVFLVALAIMDDLGAIVVIAVFYGHGIAWTWLGLAALLFFALLFFKSRKILSLWVYLPLGFLLWFFMLHSGIHATLSGVLLALVIPFHSGVKDSPSHRLEQMLEKPVNWLVLPLFAMANTALPIQTDMWGNLTGTAAMGIFFGLVLGKPLGIWLASMLAIRFKKGSLPAGCNQWHLMGAGMLGGIGFTMAIFVSNLAFEEESLIATARLAILISSVVAASLGLGWLRMQKKGS